MISESDARVYEGICEELTDEPGFGKLVTRLGYIARAQADGRLELLLRTYINQDGQAAIQACEDLASYTELMLRHIQESVPSFSTDDMQIVVSGIRTRIEGPIND